MIIGPKQTTPLVSLDTSDDQLLLPGKELGYSWTLVLDQASGKMSATLVNCEMMIVLFGACTPL